MSIDRNGGVDQPAGDIHDSTSVQTRRNPPVRSPVRVGFVEKFFSNLLESLWIPLGQSPDAEQPVDEPDAPCWEPSRASSSRRPVRPHRSLGVGHLSPKSGSECAASSGQHGEWWGNDNPKTGRKQLSPMFTQ